MENTNTGLSSALVEHGLSCLIEARGIRFLFDTGATGKFLFNAQLVNKDLGGIDTVVLSHSHFDHSGGFRFAAEQLPVKRLVTGPGFFNPKYSGKVPLISYHGCGFDQDFLASHGISHEVVTDRLELAKGLFVVSGFTRSYPFETIDRKFVRKEGEKIVADDFQDEVALVLENEVSLTLFVGCSHPGILSIVKDVNTRFKKPVTRIIGGAHLNKAPYTRLNMTCKELYRLGVHQTFFCHCSGNVITTMLQDRDKVSAYSVSCGDEIIL
jgi:7,8-dihydropterin-6-yl-methyl-4-(beta-D-ribofuranosyl)aminobenzene 5'-phosphate synthase